MNNKGFTLVELLAIVVIISVIATVAVPNITNEINSSDKHTQNVVDESIENASKLYVAKYYAKQFINGEQIKFTLTDLENDGLLNLKSGVCDGFKNKDIVVNNHIYDYKELTTSCYSKSNKTGIASTLSPTITPSPLKTPEEELKPTAIKATDNYKTQNEELFKRAMYYIVTNGGTKENFKGRIPDCSTSPMCYKGGNEFSVNANSIITLYGNGDSGVNINLCDDGGSPVCGTGSTQPRGFIITYNSSTKIYSMSFCNRESGRYNGYYLSAKYSFESGFSYDDTEGQANEVCN